MSEKPRKSDTWVCGEKQVKSIPHRGMSVTNHISYIARSAVCGKYITHYNDLGKVQRKEARDFAQKVMEMYMELVSKEVWDIPDDGDTVSFE